jgi:long-chain acyl-CoA synthetase
MRIHEEVFRVLDTWGEHPALVEVTPRGPVHSLSAADLREGVGETAAFLRRAGIGKGIPVALFLENSADFVRVLLALSVLGAVAIPLKMEYRRIELDEIFANADPQAVIAEEYHLGVIRGYLPSRTVISRSGGTLHLEQQAPGPLHPADLDESVASLNYTYRGYGYPLGVVVAHEQYREGAVFLQEDGILLEPGKRMLVVLPMTHIFTLVSGIFTPLLYRVTAVIARTIHPRVIFDTIQRHRIHYTSLVPELLNLLVRLKDERLDLSSLEAVLTGGSRIRAEDQQRIEEVFRVDLMVGYGLTEFTPLCGHRRGQSRIGTIGPLRPRVEGRIHTPDSQGQGEIRVRTRHLTPGYYRRPRETAEAFEEGWFRTGDLGRMAGDHLVFVREIKDTRKVNAMMVDLAEVQRAVLSYPSVREAQVTVQDTLLRARVRFRPGADPPAEAAGLKVFLKGAISSYKVPRFLHADDEAI